MMSQQLMEFIKFRVLHNFMNYMLFGLTKIVNVYSNTFEYLFSNNSVFFF